MKLGNTFKELENIKKYENTQSHYSNKTMKTNMNKVKPISKFRDIHDESNEEIVRLKEENLAGRKENKVKDQKIKNLNGKIRRLERINLEKDRILEENDSAASSPVGSLSQDPTQLRRRIAKQQILIMEKEAEIDTLKSDIKMTNISELESIINVYSDEISKLRDIIELQKENFEAAEDGDWATGDRSRSDLIQEIEDLKAENRKYRDQDVPMNRQTAKQKSLANTRTGQRGQTLRRRASSGGAASSSIDKDKAKITNLSKQVKLLEAQLAGQIINGDDKVQSEKDRLNLTIRDLRKDQTDLDREMDNYKKQNNEYLAEIKKLETSLKNVEDENKLAIEKLREQKGDNKKLEKSVSEMREKEMTNLRKEKEVNSQDSSKIARLQKENHELTKELREFDIEILKYKQEIEKLKINNQNGREDTNRSKTTGSLTKTRRSMTGNSVAFAESSHDLESTRGRSRSTKNNNKNKESEVDFFQNALRGHIERERSLERIQNSGQSFGGPYSRESSRSPSLKLEKSAVATLQTSIRSHKIREEFFENQNNNNGRQNNKNHNLASNVNQRRRQQLEREINHHPNRQRNLGSTNDQKSIYGRTVDQETVDYLQNVMRSHLVREDFLH